jgi:hypothetical protein
MIKIDKEQWVNEVTYLHIREIKTYPNAKDIPGKHWWSFPDYQLGEPVIRYRLDVNNLNTTYKTKKEAMKHLKDIQKQINELIRR